MTVSENKVVPRPDRWSRTTVACIVLVSLLYFADMALRASHKCFWFDELYTVSLCRLPDLSSTWAAVTQGVDFNPPLLYVFTRGVQSMFGEGLIVTRLPAMIGVWIFCLCLYFFVARRAGTIAGFIAGAFPFFTLVQYYAYEARSHGVSLGWCGLALVCWQRYKERRVGLWLAGFGFSFLGALLTHVYAVYLIVPFVAVEVVEVVRKRRPDWVLLAVMTLIFCVVLEWVLMPLVRVYRGIAIPPTFFPASHDIFQRFLTNTIGPATPILVLCIFFSAWDAARRESSSRIQEQEEAGSSIAIPFRELVVAFGFVLIPLAGLIGCKVSHGPFIDRYFLSTVAGYGILVAFASARWRARGTKKTFAGFVLLWIVVDLASAFYLIHKQRMVLFEPSTQFRLTTTPQEPMKLYETMSHEDSGLEILVPTAFDYQYLLHYAPATVASHLYFGVAEKEIWLPSYRKWAKITNSRMNIAEYGPFLATHDQFLLYETRGEATAAKQLIAKAGYRLTSVRTDAVGILYSFQK